MRGEHACLHLDELSSGTFMNMYNALYIEHNHQGNHDLHNMTTWRPEDQLIAQSSDGDPS